MHLASYLTVVQARMGSTRLPGKVMLELCSVPVIRHVVERLRLSKKAGAVIVATTVSEGDDPLCNYLFESGIEHYRGSEEDVLDRFHCVSQLRPSDAIIRATADNPLVDPWVLDKTVDFFECGQFRYARTVGFPAGIGIEVFTKELLEEAHRVAKSQYEREHVTPYMISSQESYGEYGAGSKGSQYRLTMDTPEDYALINDIYNHFYKGTHDFFLDDILQYLKGKEVPPEYNAVSTH